MENYNKNIKIVFEENEEEIKRLVNLIVSEESDMKEMLAQVSIVPECDSNFPRVYINEVARLTADTDLLRLHKMLGRDFLLSLPRIAAIRTISLADTNTEGPRVFGPYTQEMLFDQQRHYEAFDVIVTESDQQALSLLEEMNDSPIVGILLDDSQVVVEASVYSNNDEMNCASIRQAVYTALDVAHNRMNYDNAHRSPLPKLFHDIPDRGEKIRFAPFKPLNKDGQETAGNKAAL